MRIIRTTCLMGFLVSTSYVVAYDGIELDENSDLQKQLGLSEFNAMEVLSFDDTKKIGWGRAEAWAILKKEDGDDEWYKIFPIWDQD